MQGLYTMNKRLFLHTNYTYTVVISVLSKLCTTLSVCIILDFPKSRLDLRLPPKLASWARTLPSQIWLGKVVYLLIRSHKSNARFIELILNEGKIISCTRKELNIGYRLLGIEHILFHKAFCTFHF
jgi:hypothetical protein